VERLPGLRLYVQNRTVAAPDGTAPAYAGLGEVWLDDVDAARLALASSEWAAVIEDATGFMELDSVVATWATTESSRLYRPSSDPSRSHSGADPSSSARARPVERASSGKPRMVFDELLADRAREVLVELGNADERWMFGGVAFMRRGHMFAGVLGNRLVVGMGAEAAERALEGPKRFPDGLHRATAQGVRLRRPRRRIDERRAPELARGGADVPRNAAAQEPTVTAGPGTSSGCQRLPGRRLVAPNPKGAP
jgi:uncharacterized protein (TIGR02118 family)